MNDEDTLEYIDLFITNITTYIRIIPQNELSPTLIQPIMKVIPTLRKSIILKLLKTISGVLQYDYVYCESVEKDVIDIVFMLFNRAYLSNSEIKGLLSDIVKRICLWNKGNDNGGVVVGMLDKMIEVINMKKHFNENERAVHMQMVLGVIEYIIPLYTSTFVESVVMSYMEVLSKDENKIIRQSICGLLQVVSQYISYETHSNTFRHVYTQMCIDNSSTVRVEAALILPQLMKDNVAKANTDNNTTNINSYYVIQYINFTLDKDQSVQLTSVQIYSAFITQLTPNEIDPKYLDVFKNIIDIHFYNDKQNDNNEAFLLSLVNSIVPILRIFGVQSWDDVLCELFTKLLKKKNQNVTHAILPTFGVVASLLNETKVIYDLLPLFNVCITSKDKQIKQLAREQLGSVLQHVSVKDTKQIYLYFIKEILLFDEDEYNSDAHMLTLPIRHDNDKITLCDNIEIYYDVFSVEFVKEYVLRVSILLNCDKKAYVRERSSKTLACVLVYLYTLQKDNDVVDLIMRAFAGNSSFQKRKQFVYMLRYLLECKELYKKKLYEYMKWIANDTVHDVKIVYVRLIGDVLRRKIKQLEYLNEDCLFKRGVRGMKANNEMWELLRRYNMDVNWEEVGTNVEQEDGNGNEDEKDEKEVMYTDDYFNKMKLELNLEIYSRCIICRRNSTGELESLHGEDFDLCEKYLGK